MSKHTPGPWILQFEKQFEKLGSGEIYVYSPEYKKLIWESACEKGDETEANARLIAAAPELLARLKQYHERFANDVGSTNYEEVGELIANAEGEEK